MPITVTLCVLIAGILNTCTRLWLTENNDKYLKKARGHIGRNVMEITIKMNTIVRKPLMIKMSLTCNDFCCVYYFLDFNIVFKFLAIF